MNINVLFVDDEPNVIKGIKRMLHQLRKEWGMFFAESGGEALKILEENEIDVIVTDMRMPNMDGAELLSKVRELYPEVIRIILSGHSDNEMALRSTKAAHQFLSKPCDSDTLKNAIYKTIYLRKLLQNETLIKIVTGIGNLPSMPEVYLKLEEEMKSPDASMKTIGNIISQDMTMSAKILQLANSAFFGLSMEITSPEQAVNYLGTNIIKSLILYTGIFSSYELPPDTKPFLEDLWLHSIQVGTNAKKIIRLETSDKQSQDDAYIAGILHDIGKLILLQVPDYYDNVLKLMKDKNISYIKAEYETLGTSHAEVGAYLLGLWGLPQTIVETVAFHHSPSKIAENKFSVLTALHIANTFTGLSFLDINYIKAMKLENKLINYIDSCQESIG